MQGILDAILKRFITVGHLTVRWPDGSSQEYGTGDRPAAAITIRTKRGIRELVRNPALTFGECYMDGTVVPEGCGIYDVLDLMVRNLTANGRNHPVAHLRTLVGHIRRRLDQYNPASKAQRNVAHHYDLNGRLYSLFLDRDRQYSCAYFPRGNETLEEAQVAKKRHIAAKLVLDRPDLTVLDIGCGWGGLALTLARDYGARVLGITLSQEQLTEARNRAAAEGLQDRVQFELQDYRAMTRHFDRIVSVGMFEHVGVPNYGTFFRRIGHLLDENGVALIHSIGRMDGPGTTDPWTRKYIFPGGYIPALSEVLPVVERSGLFVTDIEILRLHYAETLRNWRARFLENAETMRRLYDDRFCRMWELYLAGSEMAFRYGGLMVFQLQLARRVDAVPLTRDYLFDGEQEGVEAAE